jgi:hypothetical protein
MTHPIDTALQTLQEAEEVAATIAKEALPQYLFYRDITNNQVLKPLTDYNADAKEFWFEERDDYTFAFQSTYDYADIYIDFIRDPIKHIDQALKDRMAKEKRRAEEQKNNRQQRITELKTLLEQDGLDIEIKER